MQVFCANEGKMGTGEKQMRYQRNKTRVYCGLTILEMVIAVAIITIIFAAIVPQFRAVLNSWDTRAGGTEALQNGRVLIGHLNYNLTKARRITAVSNSSETSGHIEFEDSNGITQRYDIAANNYVEFGTVGSLSDLAGPVSRLQFTCYDACDLDTVLDISTVDVNDIRFVEVETILTNAASMGQDETFTTKVYIRPKKVSVFSGLVGWWKLDETSGLTAADSSCSGNDGTLTNMVGDEWIGGAVGGALEFDGNNDYVDCGNNSSLQITGDLTTAAWVQLTSGNSGNYYGIAGKLRNATDSGFALARHDTDYFYFWIGDGTMEAVISNTTYTDTNWHHVAGVRRNGTNYLYIDGVEQTATNTRALNDSGSWAFIGRQYDDYDARYFDGLIDNVRIYNRALSAAEIAQLAEILTYQNFTEAKAGSDTTSITISTPADGGSETVEILGSWTSGLTHTAESGSNRLLIFTGHCEDDDADMDLQSVTYGGQSMTKVIERETEESSIRAYVVAYVLNEAGISAASGSTFLPTWSSTAEVVEYSSVFLQNVNQSSPTGASASNGSNTDSTISTSALSTSNGDMVIVAGTAGYTGTYSVNNGFTEAIELTIYSSDGIAGYKSADGSDETPSITHSDPYRQVIIGFVVQGNLVDPITTIEGDLLVAAVATDGDTSATLAPPGSEGWTEIDVSDYGNEVTLGAWWKLADASESTSHQFTWTGGEQAYGWMMRFTGHDPADPIDVYATDGEFSSSPTSPSVTTSVDDAIILRLGGFDDDDITEDAPGLAGHTAITMDKSASDGSVTYQEFTEAKASSDVTSITVSTPAGTSEGDLLVAAVATDGDTSTSLAPPGGEGWVEINLDQYGSAVTFGVWWKLADASESPSHQFTWSGSEQAYGWIMRFTGHDPTTPINTSNAAGGSSTSPDCPSVTTTVANTMIVRIGGFDDDDITVDSPGLSGHTAITMDESAASSYSCSGGAGYIQQAAIGASGISEFSLTGLLSEQYRTVTIAIAPDPASNTVSGGAGYVKQSASGDSGTSTFSLTESEESRTLTIAIAPDPDSVGNTSSGDCDEVTP